MWHYNFEILIASYHCGECQKIPFSYGDDCIWEVLNCVWFEKEQGASNNLSYIVKKKLE